MTKKNLTTYPQMLEGDKGEGWTVVNSGIEKLLAKTDLEGKILVVPEGDSTLERNQRLRGLAAARWTPHQSLGTLAKKHDVTPEALNAAEEYRLVFNTARASKAIMSAQASKGVISAEVVERLVEAIDVVDARLVGKLPLIVAALGRQEGGKRLSMGLKRRAKEETARGEEGGIRRHAWKELIDLVQQVETKADTIMFRGLKRSFSSFAKSVELARALMDFQEQAEGIANRARAEVAAAKGKKTQRMDLQKLQQNPEERRKVKTSPLVTRFGALTVRVPPMVMPVKAKNKIAKQRVTEEGILPFQIYRLAVDGKIFLDPRRHKGGTVLVDISGSMGLTPDEVYEFVLKCPGATIAQYSGSHDKGELVVVAHKGKIAPRHIIGNGGGGNIVDGPSLEWLSRQAKPRIWVSDTQVTGVGDAGSAGLRDLCMDHCRKHQIKIVTAFDPREVAAALHTSHRKLLKVRKENVYAE